MTNWTTYWWGIEDEDSELCGEEFFTELENADKACTVKGIPLSVITDFEQERWEFFEGEQNPVAVFTDEYYALND